MAEETQKAPLSAAEAGKAASRQLRGTLIEDLASGGDQFAKPNTLVLKFHGIYQQDDRDLRKQGVKQFSVMVRVGVPGGLLTAGQYLAMDELGATLGDGGMRITTRQDIQYHRVGKQNVRQLIQTLNVHALSTLAACGDVVRNVVSCPAPIQNESRSELMPYVMKLSRSLKPKTHGYYEVWVDGERAVTAEAPEDEEPLYGKTYLPRKFKIGFAFPGDNTTDIYSNDIGIVPEYENGELKGFNILAGGGMGMSHGVKGTHPRMADPICFIPADAELLLSVATAIVGIHRDHGNRSNRKLARLKYVLDQWGAARVKQDIEARIGQSLEEPHPLTWNRADDYLGWRRQDEGRQFLGVRVVCGRIRDEGVKRVRSGLREIVQRFQPTVGLTSQQNLYLIGIADKDRPEIERLLREYGIAAPETLPPVLRLAMACPALPTCGQAITESERVLPDTAADIQAALDEQGLGNVPVHLRTTGCPNGCARPYTAEIGIVGESVNMYRIYLGASPVGVRLGVSYAEKIKRENIAGVLRPVFAYFREQREKDEAFGDFCHRVGVNALRERFLNQVEKEPAPVGA